MVDAADKPHRICDRLAGQQILITGSTGFLAKALVEKLLRAVDTIGGIYLLVRTRTDGASAVQRVEKEVLRSPAFDRLRALWGEDFFRRCEEKIRVVSGDLIHPRLGMAAEAFESLARQITSIVNCAATVTFDERIDLALELNTLGPTRLLELARAAGNIPLLQVSTSYVCGRRVGDVVEDFSAPEPAREALPRRADTGAFDLDGLIDSIRAEAAELRHRFGADTEMCRRELVEAGMRRARASGWNDTYTLTKWLGEQLLVRDHGPAPLVVMRPAIIEGSFEEPLPGWIDGLRMADPIIVAYGKGKLTEFPARRDVALDLIPVDFVANAIIATIPVGAGWNAGAQVYHCASSERNPLTTETTTLALEKAFHRRPMYDDHDRPIIPRPLELIDQEAFTARWMKRQRRIGRLQRLCKAVGIRGRRFRRLSALARQIEQVLYLGKIYSPYTHLDCRFTTDNLRAVRERLDPADRRLFPFEVEQIDWEDYLVNRHVPGLRSFVLGAGGEATPRALAAETKDAGGASAALDALRGANLFDAFQRAVRRFGQKPALQVRREGRWLRYSYAEALEATGAIMQRFLDRGLAPGDRVAISGQSSPEWGLTYLAAMRGGLTVVPLDPQLPPEDIWAAARFAEARLMCAGPTQAEALARHQRPDDPDLVIMREPFIPRPGATRDAMPAPVPVGDTAVASILFTSGTTVSPKAVQLTHRNLMANAASLVAVHAVDTKDQLLSVLPLYHAFEFTGGLLVPLLCGATITYVDQLKGGQIVEAAQATGTTIMLIVPRLLRLFHDSIEDQVASSGPLRPMAFRLFERISNLTAYRLGSWLFLPIHRRFGGRLRTFVCGGSRLDPELFDAFHRWGFAVYEGYGLTETAPVLTVNPSGRARRGSVGPPLPGVELQIRYENLEGIGEIWVRGPNVMSAYLKNGQATREILCDGWLRTGDLGRLDGDGYLYLTGRCNDLIVTSSGKNVYPDEVEARYRDLPYTNELCVFGMPSDGGLGETVHAVIVIDRESAPDLDRSSLEREIRLAVASFGELVPPHQRITTIHFWDEELPKTSTLKAKRSLIRKMVQLQSAARIPQSRVATLSDAEEDWPAADAGPEDARRLEVVRHILARQANRPASSIRPHMHLHLDLGIDSVGKIDVLGHIESAFGLRIDNEAAAGIARVSHLLKLIGNRRPREGTVPAVSARSRLTLPSRTIEGAEAALPSAPHENGPLPAAVNSMRWLVRGGISAFMNSYVRVRVRGRAHIPETGGFILAPNHSSHLDAPSVVAAVGGKRRVWVAGAEDYFFSSRLKRFVFGRLLDTIPFDRQSDGLSGLRRCSEVLRQGDGVLIFPEGTRSVSGRLQLFKPGVALLAVEQNVPIIPVHIDRTYALLPKGKHFVKPGTVTVNFGLPLYPQMPADAVEGQYAAYRELTQKAQDAVTALANGAVV